MQITFTRDQILEYAARYDFNADDELSTRMVASAQRGHMTRQDLIEVAKWKWRGGATRKLCSQNTEAEVKEITGVSFSATSERLRIGALLSLDGV